MPNICEISLISNGIISVYAKFKMAAAAAAAAAAILKFLLSYTNNGRFVKHPNLPRLPQHVKFQQNRSIK